MKKVFFSWSAASKPNTDYLMSCLQAAVGNVGEYEVVLAARDPKQADAAEFTLKSINDCDVFIADVSAEVHAFQERKMYDENVLYEVGYAARAHGPGSIRLVANANTTDHEHLPFELQKHRILLTHFDAVNQEGLMKLFVDVLVKHEEAHTGPHPYIYLTGIAYSPVDGLKVNVRNGEDEVFYLESIEIAGSKGTVNRSLRPHAITSDLHVEGLLSPPYSDPIDVFSFIVFQPGNQGGKYKVYQKITMKPSDSLGQYAIESFDTKPLRVERVS
jgi:hypothetical protein